MDEVSKMYSQIKAQYDSNNAWSAAQAQKAMDFQERMSNTAHQREVADLKAAGLNPVLSAGGQGATTGSGVQADRSDANIDAMYGLMSKALDAQIKQAEANKVSAKAISGSSGASNPSNSLSDNPLVNVFEDWLYRKYGLKQEDVDKAIDYALNPEGSFWSGLSGAVTSAIQKVGGVLDKIPGINNNDPKLLDSYSGKDVTFVDQPGVYFKQNGIKPLKQFVEKVKTGLKRIFK